MQIKKVFHYQSYKKKKFQFQSDTLTSQTVKNNLDFFHI